MQAVYDLIGRFLPGRAQEFLCETIEAENALDIWELGSREGKILLRGNNAGSLAAAFGWYVKYTLHANISWCGKRIPLFEGEALPLPEAYRRVIPQRYRVYMNYCTHSYSAAWWNWERWEYEIDMMALNGINMPLAITGVEAIWYKTLLQLNFTDAEARAFLAGPGFFAWQWMTNLEGHGGPLPMRWITEREKLAKQILARELSFGMKPIQQGFGGCVPNLMPEKFPESRFLIKKTWNNIGHTTEIEPTDPLFLKVGALFLKTQQEMFGAYGFYACDPFHEGHPPVEGPEYLREVGSIITKLYTDFDPHSIWVMQAWSIRKDIVMAVPREKLLILDLDCQFPVSHEGYWGYDYIVGRLHNFGARMSSFHGDMHLAAANGYLKGKADAPAAVGAGLFMEGIGQNPAFYDLSLEMLTRGDSVDPYEWIHGYIHRRYGVTGKDAETAEAAWKLILDHVYVPNTDYVERGTVLCTRPCLKLRGTGPCDSFEIHYAPETLLEIIKLLRTVPSRTEGFLYDLNDFCRQLLSNYAQKLYGEVSAAYLEERYDDFRAKKDEFLTLLSEIDKMLSIRPEWTLQKWIADARALGFTDEEKDLYEYNARLQVTIWGNEEDSLLFDYAWKEWAGLIGSYHKVRWEKFFDMLETQVGKNYPAVEDSLRVFENRIVWHASDFYTELGDWETGWVHDTTPIPLAQVNEDYVFELIAKYAEKI